MKLLTRASSGLIYPAPISGLEPLGMELIAEIARLAGHDVRLIDL
jgi:hopanoid C-3 methylase